MPYFLFVDFRFMIPKSFGIFGESNFIIKKISLQFYTKQEHNLDDGKKITKETCYALRSTQNISWCKKFLKDGAKEPVINKDQISTFSLYLLRIEIYCR